VNLPQVEVVGLESPQRLLELPHRDRGVAAVGADLGHEEHAVAAVRNRPAHALFADAVVVLPGVVHERHAGVDRLVHDPNGLANRADLPEVIAADAKDGDPIVVRAERPCCDGLHGACGCKVRAPQCSHYARRTLCVRFARGENQ